jgi:hypothetical protein
MSICNNDVTYHEKWDTMENNAALKKLDNKYFDRSICSPHCPVAWAPEVYALLEELNNTYGIARNTHTIRAMRVDLKDVFVSLGRVFLNAKYELFRKPHKRDGAQLTKKQRVLNSFQAAKKSLQRAFKEFSVLYINSIINKVLRPKITLSQVKEKFGYLTLYIDCDKKYKEHIDGLIRETVIKLATKGAYYPLETILKAKDE